MRDAYVRAQVESAKERPVYAMLIELNVGEVNREEGLRARALPQADDVDLGAVAATTPGMVGADLANLANEAALLAARRGRERVAMADFADALERIVLEAERKSCSRRATANARPTTRPVTRSSACSRSTPIRVRKVSIIPRGVSLGVTFSSPEDDRFGHDQRHLVARIKVVLDGRAAEQLVYGEATTGRSPTSNS